MLTYVSSKATWVNLSKIPQINPNGKVSERGLDNDFMEGAPFGGGFDHYPKKAKKLKVKKK